MQKIRQLHCTMWAETVKEIVSAKNSEVKFIISDHPVTVYNSACPPESIECKYPNDPRIEMQGDTDNFSIRLQSMLDFDKFGLCQKSLTYKTSKNIDPTLTHFEKH